VLRGYTSFGQNYRLAGKQFLEKCAAMPYILNKHGVCSLGLVNIVPEGTELWFLAEVFIGNLCAVCSGLNEDVYYIRSVIRVNECVDLMFNLMNIHPLARKSTRSYISSTSSHSRPMPHDSARLIVYGAKVKVGWKSPEVASKSVLVCV
jgi:hypothetical protein